MVGRVLYWMAPDREPVASRALTMSRDCWSATSPKTTWRPFSHEVTTVVTKNWEPLLHHRVSYALNFRKSDGEAYVLGPALAMDSRKGLACWSLKFSSANFSP